MNRPELLLSLKKRRWPALSALLVLAALGYWLSPKLLGQKVVTLAVSKSELIQTVVASGRIEAPLRIDIGSQLTGAVFAVPVTQGQTVTAGQTLIALENADQRAALDQARALTGQAEARLRQIRELS